MAATAINAAINAYSIAVKPQLSSVSREIDRRIVLATWQELEK
jgi:hypothetical protein